MIIYLIGMPGSGKTSIGQALSKTLHIPFLDLDELIEKNALMFIDEIFETHGEDTFRRLETEALNALDIKESFIVSTGGGVVTKNENKAIMKQGKVFYIDTRVEVIKKRLKGDTTRPLLKLKTVDQLYEERFLKYQSFADYIVSNDKTIERCIEQIIKQLKKEEII